MPREQDLQRLCEALWQTRNVQDLVIVKTFLYTGIRVSELVSIQLADVDLDRPWKSILNSRWPMRKSAMRR